MKDTYLWKYDQVTQHFLKKLEKEAVKREREILDNGGIMKSPALDREYSYAIGFIAGLKHLDYLIEREVKQSEQKATQTVSRKTVNRSY